MPVCEASRPTKCATPSRVVLKAGISTRRIPSCATDECTYDCGHASWWVTNANTLDRREWLKGWVINQLQTRALAECDETNSKRKLGGWWADSFRTNGFVTGSKLWTLEGRFSLNETLMKAKQYAEEALEYLIRAGVATNIVVKASYKNPRVLSLAITLHGPGLEPNATITGTRSVNYAWLWD